jgi:hypothetical protein
VTGSRPIADRLADRLVVEWSKNNEDIHGEEAARPPNEEAQAVPAGHAKACREYCPTGIRAAATVAGPKRIH